jgi:hypothetical protein
MFLPSFYELFLRVDSIPFATSSLQDGKDEHLCALGNLGRIADHRGHLDAAKTEEHAGPDPLRPSDSDVDSPIHGMVHPVKDAALDMNLPCDTGRIRGPAVGDLHMDAKATCDREG